MLPNTRLIPDDDDCVRIEWHDNTEFKIKNMKAFKSFNQDIMPTMNVNIHQNNGESAAVALSITTDGHELMMSMNLRRMERLRATVKPTNLTGESMNLVVMISNPGPVKPSLGWSHFNLKQGGKIIGELQGDFVVAPGENQLVLHGDIDKNREDKLSGMAILKGKRGDDEETWEDDAVRLFELEVNLDEMVR
ncbi:hypothetical protein V8C37DRAFT_47959 [Trichoderma ceciliae]